MDGTSLSHILLAPWRQLDPNRRWWRRAFLGVALLGQLVIVVVLSSWQNRIAFMGMTDALALLILWPLLVSNLLEQNHPLTARLVPSHRTQLVRAALLAWVLISGLSALLLWGSLPLPISLATCWLLTAAGGVWLAQALRHWSLWILMWLGPSVFAGFNLGHYLAPVGREIAGLWMQQPLLFSTAAMVLMGGLVAQMFGRGDERHRIAHERTQCIRRAMRGQRIGTGIGPTAMGRVGEWLGAPVQRTMAAWQRHLLSHAEVTTASVMGRAEIVLHGQQHWLRQMVGTLLVLAFVALCLAITLAWIGPSFGDNWKHGAFGMAIGLMSMSINPAFMLPNMLWHSRREQALLSLLPGMPQGPALNRAVARMQLRHTLVAWALGAAAQTVLAWASGHTEVLALALAALPVCIAWPLSAPARLRAPSGVGIALPILMYVVLMVAMLLLNREAGWPLTTLATLSLLISAVAGGWRWRRMAMAPTALPAGRLA